MGVVRVKVRDQDDVRMRSVPRRNRTPHSTEMAKASGQDWVEYDSGPAVLPRDSAVSPPCQGARHGATCQPTRLELMRRWAPSQPTGCRWTFAGSSRYSLARGNRCGWSRVTLVSLLSWKFSSGSDHHHRCAVPLAGAGPTGDRMLGPTGVICRSGHPPVHDQI